MKIELVVGEPVNPPKKLNVWELDVKYMHGDADQYETQTVTYEEEANLLKDLQLAAAISSLGGSFNWYPKKRREYLTALIPERDVEELMNAYDNTFRVPDCTNDGNSDALIEDLTVRYFNKEGVEFKVKVLANDKQI